MGREGAVGKIYQGSSKPSQKTLSTFQQISDRKKARRAIARGKPVPKAVLKRLNFDGDWSHGILLVEHGHAIDGYRGKDPEMPLRGLTILHTVRNVLKATAWLGLVND